MMIPHQAVDHHDLESFDLDLEQNKDELSSSKNTVTTALPSTPLKSSSSTSTKNELLDEIVGLLKSNEHSILPKTKETSHYLRFIEDFKYLTSLKHQSASSQEVI